VSDIKIVNGQRAEVSNEAESRNITLALARTLGCEMELRQIFSRYDTLLKNCRNLQERKAISAMGVQEISNLLDNQYLGKGGSVTVGGQVIVESKDGKSIIPT
jgi:hypothetical protein